jgi:hypothetical protein
MSGALAGTNVPNFTVPEASGDIPQPQQPADPTTGGPGGAPGGQPGGQPGPGGFLGGLIGGTNQ